MQSQRARKLDGPPRTQLRAANQYQPHGSRPWQSVLTNAADSDGFWQITDTDLNYPEKFLPLHGCPLSIAGREQLSQKPPCVRSALAGELLRRAFGDQTAAGFSAFGSKIDYPVCLGD
jgi:hypothetical protein